MRLWSLHPRTFDDKTLRVWFKDTMIAQDVLVGGLRSVGVSQIDRFLNDEHPVEAVCYYAHYIADEMEARWDFKDRDLIKLCRDELSIINKRRLISSAQFQREMKLMFRLIQKNDPDFYMSLLMSAYDTTVPPCHPLFNIDTDPCKDIEPWEKSSEVDPF